MSHRIRESGWPFAALLAVAGTGMTAYCVTPVAPRWLDRFAIAVCGTTPSAAHAALLGAVLLVLARGLALRRRVCWTLTVSLTGWSALTEVESALTGTPGDAWRLAPLGLVLVGLVRARGYFPVPPDRHRVRQAVGLAAVCGVSLILLGAGLVAQRGRFTAPVSTAGLGREFVAALAADPGPIAFQGAGWLLPGLAMAGGLAVVAVLCALSAAAPAPTPGGPLERAAARELVAHPDSDTLAPFALRFDKSYVFEPGGRAAIGYRVLAGVALAGGDPIGARSAWPGAMSAFLAEADRRGWRPAVLGAGADARQLWQDTGMRAIGIGDEAVIDVAGFSLAGRRMRNVRQAVTRSRRAGIYTRVFREAELLGPTDLTDPADRSDPAEPAGTEAGRGLGAELRAIHHAWLSRPRASQRTKRRAAPRRQPEHGFAMNLDAMARGRHSNALLFVAFAADGYAVSFQRYLPVGTDGPTPALSLDVMPRDPVAPNGVNERLIVDAIEYAARHGYATVSLNFAAFRAFFEARHTGAPPDRSPVVRWTRALIYRGTHLLDPSIRVESLYRFNAKFQPSWRPRSILMRSWFDLPLVAAAAFGLEFALPYDRGRKRAASGAAGDGAEAGGLARGGPEADQALLGIAAADHANWSAVHRHSGRSESPPRSR